MAKISKIYARSDLGYYGAALVNPKNGYNVGGVIRALGAFNGKFFVAEGKRFSEKGDWRHMDTEGGHLRIPTYLGVHNFFDYVPYQSDIVVVERSDAAVPLFSFVHPKVATYVFGPEDGAVDSSAIVDKAIGLGINVIPVYIPTEYCLNLYTTATAVFYDRMSKMHKDQATIKCPKCEHVHFSNCESGLHCNACGHEFSIVDISR